MNKKRFTLLALLLAAGSGLYLLAQGTSSITKKTTMDENGHVLTARWAEYEKMQKADRPQKEAELLLGIRNEAFQKHLSADFYDAGSRYLQAAARRNWKLRDSLQRDWETQVKRFDEPIVTYTWMGESAGKSTEERWAYVRSREGDFAQGKHPAFYRNLGSYLGGALKEFVLCDKEYVLWDLLRSRELSYEQPDKDEAYQMLKAQIGERYPAWAALRYYIAARLPEENADHQPLRKPVLEALAADPAMGAVAFYPRQDLLQERFSALNSHNGSSADYKALLSECKQYLSDQSKLSGAEARIAKSCTGVADLVRTLGDKALLLSVEKDSILVRFRNLSQAEVRIYRDQTPVGAAVPVRNPVKSFFALDRVALPLPVLDDGEYRIEAVEGKVSASTYYARHTLSIAQRSEAGGYSVYVTDYITGEPLESCKLILWKGDKAVAQETVSLDGFTRLPASLQKLLSASRNIYYTLEAVQSNPQGRIRRSPGISVGRSYESGTESRTETFCNIYLERGAYNPGDTMRFKAVLFQGDLTRSAAVIPNASLEAVLYNAQGEQIAKEKLKTNEFGSIAGDFFLPEDQRGGMFRLQISRGSQALTSRSFRVDAFILPTFTLDFQPVDRLFLVGEDAEVRGVVRSYSGHSLSGASLSAQVLLYNELIGEQAVQPQADGSFALHFTPQRSGLYRTTVKVVDATGETLDFETSVYVSDEVRVGLDVLHAADGLFIPADEPVQTGLRRRYRPYRPQSAHYLVDADTVRVEMSARNTQGDRVPMDLSYVLRDGAGRVLDSASVVSGTVVALALPASGLYDLQVAAKVPGKEIGDDQRCRILRVAPADQVLDAPVRRFFLTEKEEIEPGGKIRIRMGSADGEQWAVATVFGLNREVLATRKIHLDGVRGQAGSLETLEWDWDAAWPEAVRVQVFYFKYGEAVSYDHEFHRVRTTLDLPLSFASFTDRTMPGTEYTFTLKTLPGVEAVTAVYDKSLDAFGTHYWPTVSLRHFAPAYVSCHSVAGSVTGIDPFGSSPKFEAPLPPAQPGKIVGVVADVDGEPVAGASVAVSGTAKGVVTDLDGKFVLDVPAGTELSVSCIGYVSVKVRAMSVMRVVLEDDTSSLDDVVVVGYGATRSVKGVLAGGLRRMAKSAATMEAMVMTDAVEEMAMAAPMAVNGVVFEAAAEEDAGASADVPVRERFAAALFFEPFLRSDASGQLSLTFSTSDKLSTYYVSVFAHDPSMRNALVRQEMVVTTPVKVSVVEPKYLYAGDRYTIKVSVTNSAGRDLEGGRVVLKLFASDDRKGEALQTLSAALPLLRDGAAESVEYEIEATPDLVRAGVLGLQAGYACGQVSDGVFLTVPVRPAVQALIEAHSAVLHPGMDRDALVSRLREAFANVSGADASVEEISILDMVREALPSKVDPERDDVLSLSEAWYVRRVAGSLGVSFDPEWPDAKLLERILACRNADGGFAWFEGMKSSPVITAALLERLAKLAQKGLLEEASSLQGVCDKAVRFLDRNQFDYEWPFWCGGLSVERYLYVRSFYPDVAFEVAGSSALFAKRMKEFKKAAAEYLVPKKERGLSGQILPKARRLRTLQNLLAAGDRGLSLARAWGISFGAESKLRRSLQADVVSLLEYAVDHRDGGKYYPNAVMPWRGLLESEAYAHATLCDLLQGLSWVAEVPAAQKQSAAAVADGIRLWLMQQKETQHWDTDPAFVDAIHSVLAGSQELLQTRVIALKQSYEKPFTEIAAAGNGFTVERRFLRARGVEEVYNDRTEEQNRTVLEWEEIQPGTELGVGDRIAVEYRIWNAENRSFVQLHTPREASLRPVDQLSGPYGWGIRPLRIDGLWSFQPQGYRDVKTDHTDFYFDTYPEEHTTVREEFFVTQAGRFTAPVVSVESLYAPHYRANDGARSPLESR
ncbi:MAG: carboxypeptidase-like regulatory domain-containing protein [Bacteroidales bacterium]|nr:carboxypeptidase-like regulatory domain-containing protein [Bacteroidales bacterium]